MNPDLRLHAPQFLTGMRTGSTLYEIPVSVAKKTGARWLDRKKELVNEALDRIGTHDPGRVLQPHESHGL